MMARRKGLYRVFAPEARVTDVGMMATWYGSGGFGCSVTMGGIYALGRRRAEDAARAMRRVWRVRLSGYGNVPRYVVERVDPAVLAAFSGATRDSIVALMARDRGLVE